MKISKEKLDIALARKCETISDLRVEFSSATLSRMRNNANYSASPKTVGRLAIALGVDPAELVEEKQ